MFGVSEKGFGKEADRTGVQSSYGFLNNTHIWVHREALRYTRT